MGPKKGSTKDATHESVMCPQTGFKMIDPVFVTFKDDYGNEVEMNAHNIENWIDCASKGCNKIAFFIREIFDRGSKTGFLVLFLLFLGPRPNFQQI